MNIKTTLIATLILPMGIALTACNNSSTTEGSTAEAGSAQTSDASAAQDQVKAREDVMKNWKDAMGAMKDMVKEPNTFNTDVFKEHAQYLANSADEPWQYFSDSAQKGDSLAAVWDNPEEFKAEIEKFKTATSELNAAAQSATSAEQVQDAFGKVGASCKSCHENFKERD